MAWGLDVEGMRRDFEAWFDHCMRIERRRRADLGLDEEEIFRLCDFCRRSMPLSNMRVLKGKEGQVSGLYCCECFYTWADCRNAYEAWRRAIDQCAHRRRPRLRNNGFWNMEAWIQRCYTHTDLRREFFSVTFRNAEGTERGHVSA